MRKIIRLSVSILIPLLIGFTSSFFTVTGVGSWYKTINLPSWNPPSWVFGPVWTTLYILMGISFYLIWISNADQRLKKIAVALFFIQLVLNFFWSFIFFNLHSPGLAFAEILILWAAIFFTIIVFAGISKKAAWLLVPYIGWVSFASVLNYTIWMLN
jgi:tryptophan-rich sensory protein